VTLWDELRHWLDGALIPWGRLQGLDPLPDFALEEPPGEVDADAACNLALLLAKPLKKAPRAIAQEIQRALQAAPADFIESISVAGAGFVNFRLTPARLQRELRAVLDEQERYRPFRRGERGKSAAGIRLRQSHGAFTRGARPRRRAGGFSGVNPIPFRLYRGPRVLH